MMVSITSLRTRTLLAMPTALRPSLFGAFTPSRLRSIQPRWSQPRSFSASSFRQELVKFQHVASLVVPEFRTKPLTVIRPDDFFKTSSLLSAPDGQLRAELATLFTVPVPAFLYAEGDFYKMKKNSFVPEVCILGRSNIGKSSFINAIASRRKKPIAAVSSRAGKTRSMNTYGFGPPRRLTPKELQVQGPRLEDPPSHTFYLVDTPGYGYASLEEWGDNISLYLHKRDAVKGAIVLIDAEVGPKPSDAILLQLLCDAQVRTSIVLSKADKGKKGLVGLQEVATRVRDVIHKIEAGNQGKEWPWDRDIYVTAVGSTNLNRVKLTTPIARLVVARLAGLTKDERPNAERNTRWSGKVVSFDDLQYAADESAAPTSARSAQGSASVSTSTPATSNITPSIPDMEKTPDTRVKDRTRTSKGPQAQGSVGSRSISTRAFHSASFRAFRESNSSKALPTDTRAALDDLLQSLRIKTTERERLRRARLQREGQDWIPDPRDFDHEIRTPIQRHPDMVRFAEDTLEKHRREGDGPFNDIEAALNAKPSASRGRGSPQTRTSPSQKGQVPKSAVKEGVNRGPKDAFDKVFDKVLEPALGKATKTKAKQQPKDTFDMGFGQWPEMVTKKATKTKSKHEPNDTFDTGFEPWPELVTNKATKKATKKATAKAIQKMSQEEPADEFDRAFAEVLLQDKHEASKKKNAKRRAKQKKAKAKARAGQPTEAEKALEKALARDKARNQVMDANAFGAIFAESAGLTAKKK